MLNSCHYERVGIWVRDHVKCRFTLHDIPFAYWEVKNAGELGER